jgi:hypothetical protein
VTIGEWLRSRTPAPPVALSARLEVVLATSLEESADQLPAVCLAAGERLVAELLRNDSTSRESALDLLTADALVTYAFEAAGEHASTIDAHAASAMRRISAIGAAG